MLKKSAFILCLVFLPAGLYAQQQEDNPFKRDPLFTTPLEELFGTEKERDGDESIREGSETDRIVRRLSSSGLDSGGSFEAGPYYSNALYSQYPNMSGFRFNRVNGLFLGFKKERMQWFRHGNFLNLPQIQPHGFIGYGTASREWEYALGLEKLFGENRQFMVGGEFHRALATEDFERVGLIETSFTSFFASYDFHDYYQMEGFGFYSVFRTNKWIEAAFSYNRDTFRSVEQNTGYSLFGRSSVYRLNPPVDQLADEIDLDRYGVSVSFNPRKVLLDNNFTLSGRIIAEMADNSATDEDYRYNKYQGKVSMFYNFEPGSVLRWRLQAGGITGNAPDVKSFYLGGIGTLRGSPFKFFQGNQMLLSNLEIQFGRPSSRSGEWLRNHNLNIMLFLDSGWTKQVPEMVSSSGPLKGFSEFSFSDLQHDAGIGAGKGSLRAELAWPLKHFDSSPTFWIRFNPTF